MYSFLNDVFVYKELALLGVPKLFTGEEFASIDEQEAVTAFIGRFGFRFDNWMNQQLEGLTDREEYNRILLENIDFYIHNTFRGNYGI